MPTLLVNQRMAPALRARIQSSVGGAGTGIRGPRLLSVIRFGALLTLVAFGAASLLARRQERSELEGTRAALLDSWAAQSNSISPKDRGFLERTERFLARFAGPYPGDQIAPELREIGALAKTFSRPSVYFRGPLSSAISPAGISVAAADSNKDTLILCLLDPPESREEKLLLVNARLTLAGGTPFQQLAPNVRRLHDIEVGLPFLLPPWGERVLNAPRLQELLRLERELKKAPIANAKVALRSELLIAVLDEPNDPGGATELDGEHAHSVRLAVLELATERLLLRFRRPVDPDWITPRYRSKYARELDSCKFALDVRDAVIAQESPSAPPAKP